MHDYISTTIEEKIIALDMLHKWQKMQAKFEPERRRNTAADASPPP
jgi:hypothetical protein